MVKNLETFKSENGSLFALNKIEEFTPRRMFYVTDVQKGESRGFHAHKRDKQLLVCVKGKISVTLDNGASPSEFLLREGQSVFMDTLIWGVQKYLTGEDILLVLCSEEHDESEYIKSYFQFLKTLKEKRK